MGMRLSGTIISSVLVMLVFSILPAYADTGVRHGICANGFDDIEIDDAVTTQGADLTKLDKVDKNDNGHVCWKMKGNGDFLYKDDNAKGLVKELK